MSTSPRGDGPSQADFSQVVANKRRPLGNAVRALMLVMVSAGAIFFAGWTVWMNNHPVQAAARGLRSGDPSQRVDAVRQLWTLGTSASGEVIDSLIPALRDPNALVRGTAVEALGVIGAYTIRSESGSQAPGAVVTALTETLKDTEPSVRSAAATALGIIVGTVARPSSGRGSSKASQKAKAPESSIDPAAVNTLLFDLVGDRDTTVRQAALSAIRQVSSKRHGEPPQALFSAVEDESATTRASAVGTLVTFSSGLDPLIPALLRHLEQDEPSVRAACSQALGEIQPSSLTPAVIPALIAGLPSPDRDVRLHLVSLVGRMSPEARTAVPALIKVLREPIDSDQISAGGGAMSVSYAGPAQEAARALGRIAPRTPSAGDAIAALTEILRSGPPKRRAAAAAALGQFGPAAAQAAPAMVTLLQAALASKEPTGDGPSAAAALGQVAPGSASAAAAVTALTVALNSPESSTRLGALRALRSFGPAAAGAIATIRAIQEKDSTPNIRKSAAATLEALEGRAP
jgi:HEAT repeat protein